MNNLSDDPITIDAFTFIVAKSSVENLLFSKEIITSHPDSGESKIGYKLTKIGSIEIPDSIKISYVECNTGSECYYYVIIWNSDSPPRYVEVEANSENDAKQSILNHLKDRFTVN